MLRAVYAHSGDDISTGVDQPDTSGFNMKDVDGAFWGAQGPYRWRLSFDADGNPSRADLRDILAGGTGTASEDSFTLEDAWVSWTCSEYFDATMGQFKPRLTRSNSVDPEKQIMINRTVIGSALDFWDEGVGAAGSMDLFNWYVGLMNGEDGAQRSHLYYARGEYHMGSGAGEYEGATGSSDQLNATVGLTVLHADSSEDVDPPAGDTDTNSDNTSWIADFNGKVSQFGFGAEIAGLDDDEFFITAGDYGSISDSGDEGAALAPVPGMVLVGDSTPWAVTGSYMLNEEWEFAVRYEDLDNSDNDGPDNSVISVGANWYRGTAARWQAQFSMIDADSAFNDGDVLEVGYAVGATR
jgi:hypothetical protein